MCGSSLLETFANITDTLTSCITTLIYNHFSLYFTYYRHIIARSTFWVNLVLKSLIYGNLV